MRCIEFIFTAQKQINKSLLLTAQSYTFAILQTTTLHQRGLFFFCQCHFYCEHN